ncbi:MAG: HEAT repeat domain-containing protein [Myxococcales bacterium]
MIRLPATGYRLPALVLVAAASRVEIAVDALQHDSSLKVRTQAAIILGQRGAREAIPALRQAVASDDSAAVRLAAIGALVKLRARAARPTLAAARDADPDDSVRDAARGALDALGAVTVRIEEPTGTPSAHAAVRSSLTNRLRELGVNVGDTGEIRLKPKVALEVADSGGRTVISVKTSVLTVDGDGHVEMMEGTAQATANGTLSEARIASTSDKVIDAALKGICQDLAMKLGRR